MLADKGGTDFILRDAGLTKMCRDEPRGAERGREGPRGAERSLDQTRSDAVSGMRVPDMATL